MNCISVDIIFGEVFVVVCSILKECYGECLVFVIYFVVFYDFFGELDFCYDEVNV